MVVMLAACGGESPTAVIPTPATPVGAYDIQTVNGKAVPAVVAADGNYTQELTGSNISLTSDGKYSIVVHSRVTIPGNVQLFVDSSGGTWTQSAGTIQLTSIPDGVKDSATWDKGLLTFVEVDATTTPATTTTLIYYQHR